MDTNLEKNNQKALIFLIFGLLMLLISIRGFFVLDRINYQLESHIRMGRIGGVIGSILGLTIFPCIAFTFGGLAKKAGKATFGNIIMIISVVFAIVFIVGALT